MTYGDMYQQTTQQNPQQWGGLYSQQFGPSAGQQFGSLGQHAASSQPFGQAAYGGQVFGQPNIGGFGQNWMQQRQLSQQDVGEIVRQLVPLLPQVLAQTQQSPGIGYGAYGTYGQTPRLLTQQDVNEVVRQILPMVPQIVALLQGQSPWQSAAAYGGWSQIGQTGFGQAQGIPYGGIQGYGMTSPQQHWQQQHWQQPFGQFGTPQFLGAYGGPGLGGQSQRQLTQQDVNDVVRQLIGVIPQVMGNLQAVNQQRTIN